VYQFEALAGFSAVIDRLGEFKEVLDASKESGNGTPSTGPMVPNKDGNGTTDIDGHDGVDASPTISSTSEGMPAAAADGTGNGVTICDVAPSEGDSLLDLNALTLRLPGSSAVLLRDLELEVRSRHSVLIMGPRYGVHHCLVVVCVWLEVVNSNPPRLHTLQ
jgi:ABC-type uncharacterized transport system fused permease/ATPase subunit